MVPIYWGIFVPNMGGRLDDVVIFQHVTFGFKTEWPEELHGKLVDIVVVGYGDDGRNEAYSVELPDWTIEYYDGAPIPHITLSVSKSAKPVDSWKIDFNELTNPFKLGGVFGYFDKEGIHL